MHILNSAHCHAGGVVLRTTHGKRFTFDRPLPAAVETALRGRPKPAAITAQSPQHSPLLWNPFTNLKLAA